MLLLKPNLCSFFSIISVLCFFKVML
jgi:hypothetical protein